MQDYQTDNPPNTRKSRAVNGVILRHLTDSRLILRGPVEGAAGS